MLKIQEKSNPQNNFQPFTSYNGGKSGSGTFQTIINLIPEHSVYIEGFLGNGGILSHIKPASVKSIGIDIDPAVSQKWSMRTASHNNAVLEIINNDFFTVIDTVIKDSFRILSHKNEMLPGSIAEIVDAAGILTDLVSHNSEMLAMASQIFLYLDPPYLLDVRSCKTKYYRYDMISQSDHIKFLDKVLRLSLLGCRIMISHYPCNLYDHFLNNWNTVDYESMTRKGKRIERLYMNYEKPTVLHDYRYIGNDFRERELHNKMKRNLISKLSRLPELQRNMLLSEIIEHFGKPGALDLFKRATTPSN